MFLIIRSTKKHPIVSYQNESMEYYLKENANYLKNRI